MSDRLTLTMVGGTSYSAMFEGTDKNTRVALVLDYGSEKHPYKVGDKIVLSRREIIR